MKKSNGFWKKPFLAAFLILGTSAGNCGDDPKTSAIGAECNRAFEQVLNCLSPIKKELTSIAARPGIEAGLKAVPGMDDRVKTLIGIEMPACLEAAQQGEAGLFVSMAFVARQKNIAGASVDISFLESSFSPPFAQYSEDNKKKITKALNSPGGKSCEEGPSFAATRCKADAFIRSLSVIKGKLCPLL